MRRKLQSNIQTFFGSDTNVPAVIELRLQVKTKRPELLGVLLFYFAEEK